MPLTKDILDFDTPKKSESASIMALFALLSTGGWVTRTMYLFAPELITSVFLELGLAVTKTVIFSFSGYATVCLGVFPA
jgi:hypothetical protein